MGEPTRIYVLSMLPSGQTTWLTMVNAVYTEREDADRAAEFFRTEFPLWECKIDTYVKEGE